MKYFLSVFFLSFCLSNVSAQEKHFVFIQSDNKQPFYVSVNGKLYSSSASGYVIIPKLADGNYNFTVGFAQNTFPEQTFSVLVQNKDLGYELKNFNEKGWGLFNLQSLDITMASAGNTNVVAKALSDDANAKTPQPVISFNKKKEPPRAVNKPVADSATNSAIAAGDNKQSVTAVNAPTAVTQKATLDSVAPVRESPKAEQSVATNNSTDVKKVSEVSGTEGVQLSYIEGSGKNKDTILVMIPSSPAATSSPTPSSASTDNSKNTANQSSDAVRSERPSSTGSQPKFLDISMGARKDTATAAVVPRDNTRILENSNCKNVATEDDYWKLRKKMSMEASDERMISEARKYYRNKCFTTTQIKGLSTLFLSDEGRFKFFDASFVSVADATEYYKLESEFIDPAFASRFKALLQ